MYKIDEEELHKLAVLFMDLNPSKEPLSLDEYMSKVSYRLDQRTKDLGYHILSMFSNDVEY